MHAQHIIPYKMTILMEPLQKDYPYGSLWNLSLYIFVRK